MHLIGQNDRVLCKRNAFPSYKAPHTCGLGQQDTLHEPLMHTSIVYINRFERSKKAAIIFTHWLLAK